MTTEAAVASVIDALEELQIPFITALQRDVWLPTAEDVLIQKLRWQRSKDLDDVKAIIAVSGETLDWDYIGHWATQHETQELLRQVRAAIPNLDDVDDDL